jgi:hypothetical protein
MFAAAREGRFQNNTGLNKLFITNNNKITVFIIGYANEQKTRFMI